MIVVQNGIAEKAFRRAGALGGKIFQEALVKRALESEENEGRPEFAAVEPVHKIPPLPETSVEATDLSPGSGEDRTEKNTGKEPHPEEMYVEESKVDEKDMEETALDWVRRQGGVYPEPGTGDRSNREKKYGDNVTPIPGSEEGNASILEHVKKLEDAGQIKLHRDGDANQAADEMGAKAFTVGRDIYLGSDYSDLDSGEARSVLAHELKHVEQFIDPERRGEMANPGKRAGLEREAREAGEREKVLPSHVPREETPLVHNISVPEEPGNSSTQDTLVSESSVENIPTSQTHVPGSGAKAKVESLSNVYESAPRMEHMAIHPAGGGMATGASTSAFAASSSPQAMAAMEDEGDEDFEEDLAVQGASFGQRGRFAKVVRRIRAARKRDLQLAGPNFENLTDEVFRRIKEMLVIERERFSK